MNNERNSTSHFAICINHGGYPESLEVMKLYQVLPDADAARHGQLRVIDESGEDYLYFASLFVVVDFPASAERALTEATSGAFSV